MGQGAAAQVFGDDVGPAFSFHRDKLQQVRMIQLEPNLLLALKAGKESRIGLQTQVRHLDGNDLIFLFPVPRLVNGGHAASAHRFDDGEPPVEQIAGMQLRAEVRFDRVMVFGHVLKTTDAFHGVGFVCVHAFVWSTFQGRLH